MSNELEKLHIAAFDLREVGMLQTAGDIDYLVSWLKSPEFNNGFHLAPHPAGENTIDAYSNNCPIPFTASRDTVKVCKAKICADAILSDINDLLIKLKKIYTDDLEVIALDSYIEYVSKVRDLLDKEELNDWIRIFPEMGQLFNEEDISKWLEWDHNPIEL